MKLFLILFALTLIVATMHADLALETRFTVGKITNDTIVKIKGDKIGLDSFLNGHEAWNRIVDLKTGHDFTIFPIEKRIVSHSLLSNEENITFPDVKWPKFHDMDKTEKMNGYETDIYERTNRDSMGETLWVAKNFPDFDKIRTDFIKLDNLDIMHGMPELRSLSGMPLKLEMSRDVINEKSTNKLTMLLTLISAKEESVDDSIFELPKDYHF